MIKCAQVNGLNIQTEGYEISAAALMDAANQQGAFPSNARIAYPHYFLWGFYTGREYAAEDTIYIIQEPRFIALPNRPATAQ